jgi:hypothetical protein
MKKSATIVAIAALGSMLAIGSVTESMARGQVGGHGGHHEIVREGGHGFHGGHEALRQSATEVLAEGKYQKSSPWLVSSEASASAWDAISDSLRVDGRRHLWLLHR